MSLFASKRGQIRNYVAGIVIIFILSLTSLFMYLILNSFLTEMSTIPQTSEAAATEGVKYLSALRIMDVIIVILVVGLIIGVGLTSFRLSTAPGFFIISLISATFLGFVGYFFSSLYAKIVSDSVFNSVTFAFPRSILIATNLHWIGLLFFAVGSITLYAKKPSGGVIE